MKFTTLLMDADDTIFDFPKCEYAALKNTLETFGLNFTDEVHESFSSINSHLWKEFENNRITCADLRIQRFRELIEKCFNGMQNADQLASEYIDRLSQQAILIDGAYDALKMLSEYFSIYIITNGLKKVQRGRFGKTEISRFIKKLYISDEMNVQKPRKEFFDMVLSDIEEKDSRKVLVVGDSLTSDMQGGRNAGIATCLYDPHDKVAMPEERCDYKIRDLREIMMISSEDRK